MRKNPRKDRPNAFLAHTPRIVAIAAMVVLLGLSIANGRRLSEMERRFDERFSLLESRLVTQANGAAAASAETDGLPRETDSPPSDPERASAPLAGVRAAPSKAPESGRVYTFDLSRAPSQGPLDAPVTIVEFSDFQCSFCKRAQPTLERLRDVYGDRIRLVFKHLPLEMHADAPRAHLASVAAANQGEFWEFKRRLFSDPGNLKPEDLQRHAWELGLDSSRFEADLSDPRTRRIIEADMAEAVSIDLTAAPGFFVNGRYIRGAKPFEDFAEAIDAELARLGLAIPEKGIAR